MLRERPVTSQVTPRTAYLAVYLAVSLFFLIGTAVIFWWIVYRLRSLDEAAAQLSPPTPGYVNYDISGPYTQTPEWQAAQQQVATYIQQNPQPQNVQVLTGLSTAEIYGYMVNQVSAGLKVGCNHCHTVTNGQYNFADYNNPNKVRAAAMMLMVGDLNKNWLTQLPASVGNKQIACATCHNGVNAGINMYPQESLDLVPLTFRLPLDREFPGGLQVTGDKTKSLDEVALNQYTMYHMNASLGQGCTFCHNARYFPSDEIAQKSYAIIMLNMAKHLNGAGTVTLNIPGIDPGPYLDQPAGTNQFTYLQIMRNKSPSCWNCHQGARLPPGSMDEGQVPPPLRP